MSWSDGVLREVLPNGLTVLIQPVPDLPAVAIVTRVKAGFFDEPDRWQGISHVLEHMFFKGTPTRGVGEIARDTKAAGGYLNAATSYDYTAYYAVLPVGGLAAGLEIQADALQHPLIDPGELDREIGVILQEARRKLDTPSAVTHETLHELLFDQHRIRRWRIGTEAVLTALTRDDVVAYYRTRYVPSRTILVIAGGMDPDLALTLARDHYAAWQGEPPVLEPSPVEPGRRGRRVRTLRGDVRQADLVLGWRTVPALHPDAIPLDLAAAILSAGRASWLYRALRETGFASAVGAWNYSPTEVGVFSLSADLDPARLDEAMSAMAGQVARLREEGPDRDTLDRARALLRAGWARRFESAEGRASELAAAEALRAPALLDEEYERLMTLTPDEVREAVARHLDPGSTSAVAFLPRAHDSDVTQDRLAAALDTGPVLLPGIPRRALPPPVRRRAAGRQTADVLHVPLGGVDLLLRRRRGVPTVTLGVYRLRAGQEEAPQAGLGSLAVRSALRGAGGLEGPALAEMFERLGGSLSPAITPDWFGFQSTVLRESLVEAATLLDLVLTEPMFTADAVAIERALLADDAAQVGDDMFRYPVHLAYRAAFGERGYGLPVLGRPETVRGLEAEQARAWHRAQWTGGRTTVVAVGDLDPEEAASLLAGRFAGHPAAPTLDPGAMKPNGGVERRQVVEHRDKSQTALAMFFPGPDRVSPERHVADVWTTIAGGLGGRLFEALRDRRSLAYTVAAFTWQRRRAGAVLTYIATSPEREEEARREMLAEIARFAEDPPRTEEAVRAVSYLVGQMEVGRQRAGALAGELLDAWLQGTGLEELEDPAAPYRAVTAEQVRSFAMRWLDGPGRAEGIVRGTGGGGAGAV